EVLAGDGLHRAGRALARITPGMLLAEDHAREHVLSHRLRIVEGLRDLAEPLDPDALDVRVPELRIEGDVREDFQHWIEGIGERRHRDPRGVRLRGGGIPRSEILESTSDGGGIARGGAFVEEVEGEGSEPGLADGLGVGAGAQGKIDGDQRNVMALDQVDGESIAEGELLRNGGAEFHGAARRRRLRAERGIWRSLRRGLCLGRGCRRLGGFRDGGRAAQENECRPERSHRLPPAAACFCSGSTVITTRCSSFMYRLASCWTCSGVTASVASRFLVKAAGSFANISKQLS